MPGSIAMNTMTKTVLAASTISTIQAKTSRPLMRCLLNGLEHGGRRPCALHDGGLWPIGPNVEGEIIALRRRKPIRALGIGWRIGLYIDRQRAVGVLL